MHKDKAWLKRVIDECNKKAGSAERKSNLELFKGVANSLVKDALKVLEEIEVEWELDHNSQELREKYYLLRHYLDYLRRFCEGKV
ncbi:MAG: hypothetical protein ACE5K3_10810 [bacterium]